MVREVSGDHEGEGADGEGIVAGDAAARPGVRGHIPKKRNRGEADAAEFLDVLDPGNLVGVSRSGGDVLIETGKRRGETASEPESALVVETLAVVHVTERFANAPFIRSVAMKRFLLRNAGEECERRLELGFDGCDGVVALDFVDVGEVVGGGFGGFGASGHAEILLQAVKRDEWRGDATATAPRSRTEHGAPQTSERNARGALSKHLRACLEKIAFRFNRRKRFDLFVATLRHVVTALVLTFGNLKKEAAA